MTTRYDRKGKSGGARRRRARQRRGLVQQVQQTPQFSFDRKEIVQLLPDSLDTFAIEIGRQAAVGLLLDEVEQWCGPRHQ